MFPGRRWEFPLMGISPLGPYGRNKPKHKQAMALRGGCCIFLLDRVTWNLLCSFLTVVLLHVITAWTVGQERGSRVVHLCMGDTVGISGCHGARRKRPRTRWLSVSAATANMGLSETAVCPVHTHDSSWLVSLAELCALSRRES